MVIERPSPTTEERLQIAISDVQSWYYQDTGSGDMSLDAIMAEREAMKQREQYITDTYGSPDQAITAAGALVVSKAEEYAGVTAAEAQAGWEDRMATATAEIDEIREKLYLARKPWDDAMEEHRALGKLPQESRPANWSEQRQALMQRANEHHAAFRKIEDESGLHEARTRWNDISSGRDEATLNDLRNLSKGYQQAITDVRPIGGQDLTYNARSTKKAQELFNSAVQVFPTNWIEAANSGKPLVAKIQDSRAHYTAGTHHTTKKKVQRSYLVRLSHDAPEPKGDRFSRYEKVDSSENGSNVWRRYSYETAGYYDDNDPNRPPKGTRWEFYEEEGGGIWRRPQMRMQTIESEMAPEIKTNRRDDGAMMGPGVATAQHECSHLFEHQVPGIKTMEQDFLVRRTTTDGTRDKLTVLYKGTSERTRADSFVVDYMGKDYGPNGYREVLSMGSEAVFSGKYGGLIGVGRQKPDHDMRNFILGVLATAKK